MDIIKEWVHNLFIILLVLSFVEMLLPDNSLGKYVRFIFSLIVMSALIYPFFELLKAY